MKWQSVLRWPAGIATAALVLLPSVDASAFECAERHSISVMLCMDASGSMSGAGQVAASNFAVSVLDSLSATGHLSQAGDYFFAVAEVHDVLTTNILGIRSNLVGYGSADISANDGTWLFGAIFDCAFFINQAPSGNARLLVVLTDGEDTGSIITESQAVGALAGIPGTSVELIHAGGGTPGELTAIANAAGAHVRARAATLSSLNSLVTSIVDRTCTNWRPTAAFDMSPGDGLDLGLDGFTIAFDGSPSADQEDADSALTYAWRLTPPSGAPVTFSGMAVTRTFTDAHIGTWQAQLTVTDTRGASASITHSFQVRGSAPDITLHAPTLIEALEPLQLEVTPTEDIDGGGTFTFTWVVESAPATAAVQPPGPTPPWSGASVSWTTTEGDITVRRDGTRLGRWRFRVTAEDNEHETDVDTKEVDVRNLLPTITFDGPHEIDVGDSIHISSEASEDPDGGAITWDWDLIQVPASSGLAPVSPFASGSVWDDLTGAGHAGTWIFRHVVTDNEGESVDEDFEVLVDGEPTATIVADTVSAVELALDLIGDDSVDPDSPCPGDPDHCHLSAEPPVRVSPGIVRYSWTLLDVPSDAPDGVAPGYVSDVLNVDGGSATLHIPAGRLSKGFWTFQLEVEDGEHNTASTTHVIEMVHLEGPPYAIAFGPLYRSGDASGSIAEAIALTGSWSFDPDNLLSGTPLPGITAYDWATIFAPPGCTPPALAPGATTIAWPAGPVPLSCYGLSVVQLTVTDDDATPKQNTAAWPFVLSNCAGIVCVDTPSHDAPAEVDAADHARVFIAYHLNAAVYQLAGCASGCWAQLAITRSGDPAHILYSFSEPNPIGTTLGGQHSFEWNGFITDPVTGERRRPDAGQYDVTVRINDVFFAGIGHEDTQTQSILIQVANATIDASSDGHLSLNQAEAGTDQVSVHYSIAGAATVTDVRTRVYIEGQSDPLYDSTGPAGGGNVVVWGGRDSGGALVPPGRYEVTVTPVGPFGELGESARHGVVAYHIDLALDGVADTEEDTPGAFLLVGDTIHQGHVALAPAGLDGEVVLSEDPATSALEAVVPMGDLALGISITPSSANPETAVHFKVTTRPSTAIHLRARYLPLGAPASKEAVDEVTVDPVELDVKAPCSDDDREASDGIFVQRRLILPPAPVDFPTERFMMRQLHLKASHRFERVHVSVRQGGMPSTSATLFQDPFGVGVLALAVGADFDVDPTAFAADGTLDTELYVRGLERGEAELVVELVKDGAVLTSDTVKLRIGDLPPLAGAALATFPFWRGTRALTAGQPLAVALDPAYHDERRTLPAKVYVVDHKLPADWAADATLIDVTGVPDDLTVPAAPGTITGAQVSAWAAVAVPAPLEARALDVVVDYGGCPQTPAVPSYGTLDPEDIILPLDAAEPPLIALADLTAAGPLATATFEYGDDVENTPAAGAICTPREDRGFFSCNVAAPLVCPIDSVCVDSDGDGNLHCARVRPPENSAGAVCPPACPNGQVCWDGDHDGTAHCKAIDLPEDVGGAVCPPACPVGSGCYDTDGDGVAHCTAIAPLCPAGETCVSTNGDHEARCRSTPTRIHVPSGYDTFRVGDETSCVDGVDNSGEGDIDCADVDCFYSPACRTETSCTNGVDDDGDGLTDCDDIRCAQDCLPGLRLRGRVIHPNPIPAGAPLVVMAHGRHTPFNVPGSDGRWREATALTSDQNYRGHTYLQQHLASHGFVTVSVDLDEVVGKRTGYPTVGAGNRLRAWLTLKNIEHVLGLPQLAGVASSQIYLLGHSRGGEAVLEAWWVAGDVAGRGPASSGGVGPDAAISNFTQADLRGVMSIAPTSFDNLAPPLGPTIPFFLLYGTADGDVNGTSVGVQPRRHYDRADGPRAAIHLRGGNHNHFNTSWVGDDHTTALNLIAGPDQRTTAMAWGLAWLRTAQGQPGFSELFEQPASRLPAGGVPVSIEAYTQSRRTPAANKVLDDYETNPAITLSSAGLAVAKTGGLSVVETPLLDPHPTTAGDVNDHFTGETTGAILTWTAAGTLTYTLSGPTDLRARRSIALRAAQQPGHPNTTALAGPLSFLVTLIDGNANESTISIEIATALTPIQGSMLGALDVSAALFQTIRIDLDRFVVGNPGLELDKITAVRVDLATGGGSMSGAIGFDDVEFE